MKAVILAGGYGKRLRPFTDEKPKPLLEVAGRPILEWQILLLKKKFNISSFIILAGYKKEVLLEWVTNNQQRLGISPMIATESEPLGTGGAIKHVEDFLKSEDEFLVLNGDIITNIDINKLELNNAIVAISLVPLRSPYGVVQLKDDRIVQFVEKPLLKDYWINAGIYKMSSDVFDYLPEKGDIEKTTFPLLAEKGLLQGVKFEDAYWRSIDTLKDLEEASAEVPQVFSDIL
ncbi:MAG: nucleotidyltransferase family protein [Sulfolobaceae archaeon]|nr:nucleotidyltransferase family protein [Sulfolobaceae archaeon]